MAAPRPTWQPVRVARVVQETPRDRTLELPVPAGQEDAFRFQPGQFVTLRDPGWDGTVQRAYSISSSPRQTASFTITVRDMGRTGDHVYHLKPGQELQVLPPRGAFVLETRPGDALVLVGGGSGVAPYRAFVRYLAETGHADPVTVLSSAREPAELLFHDELGSLAARHPWLSYVPTVTRPPEGDAWTGRRGRIDADLLRSAFEDPTRARVYACGPTTFVEAIVDLAVALGVPKDRIRREKWG